MSVVKFRKRFSAVPEQSEKSNSAMEIPTQNFADTSRIAYRTARYKQVVLLLLSKNIV